METALRRNSLAGILILAFTTACAAIRREPEPNGFRVATYNIQAGANLPGVISALREIDADIVGLQEVDVHWSARSAFADQAQELATALGMQVRFAPIYQIPNADPRQPMREYGVAVLSRFPIVEFRNDTLTRLSTQDTSAGPIPMPGMVNAVVTIGRRRVRVLVTHLDYRADPRVRGRQATEMAARLSASPEPALALGDFNAAADSPELRPLFDRLRDVWSSALGTGYTYPANAPVKRIDLILATPDFLVGAVHVGTTMASDHRPLVANLSFRATP